MVEINCVICGTIIKKRPSRIRNANYCSRKCQREGLQVRVIENCFNCGKKISRIPSAFKPKGFKGIFCSRKCSAKHRWENSEKIPRIVHDSVRRTVVDNFGRKCFICGYDRFIEFCHLVPAKVGGTIHPDNILPLCPNHHRLFDHNLLTSIETDKISENIKQAFSNPNCKRQKDKA